MSPDVVQSNLRAHWDASARTGRRQRGRNWYPTARQWAADLAAETGRTLEQVVAVLAITSPGIQLTTNIAHTARIIRGERDTGGRFPNVNRPKIARALSNPEYASEYVSGPKVGPFFRAILGDTGALVLDRWALYAATGDSGNGRHTRDEHGLTKERRAVIEDAYGGLARKVGLTVRDLQAVLWIQVRETTPTIRNGKSIPVRLADITAS